MNKDADKTIQNLLRGKSILDPCIEQRNVRCIRDNLREYGLVYTKQLEKQTNGELNKITNGIVKRGKETQTKIDALEPGKDVDRAKAVKLICELLTYDAKSLHKYIAKKQ